MFEMDDYSHRLLYEAWAHARVVGGAYGREGKAIGGELILSKSVFSKKNFFNLFQKTASTSFNAHSC